MWIVMLNMCFIINNSVCYENNLHQFEGTYSGFRINFDKLQIGIILILESTIGSPSDSGRQATNGGNSLIFTNFKVLHFHRSANPAQQRGTESVNESESVGNVARREFN
jgi:hypothetical protein